jgi:hypothetical protein
MGEAQRFGAGRGRIIAAGGVVHEPKTALLHTISSEYPTYVYFYAFEIHINPPFAFYRRNSEKTLLNVKNSRQVANLILFKPIS